MYSKKVKGNEGVGILMKVTSRRKKVNSELIKR